MNLEYAILHLTFEFVVKLFRGRIDVWPIPNGRIAATQSQR
jgi:hypothetical protein